LRAPVRLAAGIKTNSKRIEATRINVSVFPSVKV
jgi:hypothetical protein